MDLLGIYFLGAAIVFSVNWIGEVRSLEYSFQKSILWPILLVKSIIKGIRNEL